MHHIASVFLSFFLSPFNWVFILIVAGYFLRKASWRKICRLLALFIFVLFGNQWLLDLYAKQWQPAPVIFPAGTSYSCGIVPGGFASPDADANGYFNSTADRFIEVVKLFKIGAIKHILISGGNGKTDEPAFREAAWVKRELVTLGIPDSVIFAEDRSDNTADNAVNAKRIFDSLQLPPPYLLITSAQHVPRAALLFRNAGVSVVAFPCSYIAGRGSFHFSSLVPEPGILLTWNVYLKETMAYLWYKIKG
ncbi:MAG: YdcF family protein [Ginsengibacter sp.]